MITKLTVLGSGTSSGVPVIGCPCAVCHSLHPKNRRLRTSCWIAADGVNIIIDTGPDFRQQVLSHGIPRVDAVLYSHTHADHILGIDDLRIFNAWQGGAIPVYGSAADLDDLKRMFRYIFCPASVYPSLVPSLVPHVVTGPFFVGTLPVVPIVCEHGQAGPTTNYRIGNMAWIPDVNGIPAESWPLLKGLDCLFIDGLRYEPHPTHFCFEEVLAVAQKIGARKTYLIHLTHDYDFETVSGTLPAGIELAYDGLIVQTS